MDLSFERWNGIRPAEREALAKHLAKELPSSFYFSAVRLFRLGERECHVALFQRPDATFALIPGATVSLGYDSARPYEPSPGELESWQGTAEEYGINKSLQEYVAEVTLRPRLVELAPFLIETAAKEVGWEPVGTDDPEVQEILRQNRRLGSVEICRGGVRTRVREGAGDEIIAERSVSCTYADLASQLKATGSRFPTSDEWEYACGAGAPTLFRWGDHVPCDRYPINVGPAHGGPLADGFLAGWDDHRQPNAFGLSIASNPYECEMVAEVGVTRGGDGGCLICGGAGFFIGWLTLATAYFEEHSCKHDAAESIQHGYTVGRRVLEL